MQYDFTVLGPEDIMRIHESSLRVLSEVGLKVVAASALITKDPFITGTIASQDWIKVAATAVMSIGVILYAVGIKTIYTIMGI